MLLHQIHDAFHNRIEDPEYWDDDRATSLANGAQDAVIRAFSIKIQAYVDLTTVDGTKNYKPPQDYLENYLLHYNSTYNLDIMFLGELSEIVGVVTDPDLEGQPTHAYMWAISGRKELHLYPVPDDAYTIQWWYYALAPTLELDNDEPMIPREFQSYLIDHMLYRANINDDKMSEVEFETLWNLKLFEMKKTSVDKVLFATRTQLSTAKEQFPQTGSADISMVLADPSGTYIW